jgi:hypothetical protein
MIELQEKTLYQPIGTWLKAFIESRTNSDCTVWDGSQRSLGSIIDEAGIESRYPEFDTYDFRVDVVAVYGSVNSPRLALVEVKLKAITLKDIGQLLGYCIVSKPELGLLLSPEGPNSYLSKLLNVYGRTDVLIYKTAAQERRVTLARWNINTGKADIASAIPPGSLS